jgi:hypothetical protein
VLTWPSANAALCFGLLRCALDLLRCAFGLLHCALDLLRCAFGLLHCALDQLRCALICCAVL